VCFSSTGGRVKSGKRSMLARMLMLLRYPRRVAAGGLDQIYPQLDALYSISTRTRAVRQGAADFRSDGDELRKLGYEVTAGVGGTGVVACCATQGPAVLLAPSWTRSR